MQSLDLRAAAPGQAEDIWQLVSTSFAGPHSRYVATGQPGYRQYLEAELKGSHSKSFFVVVRDGRIAAFADVTLNSAEPNFLTRIVVDPAYRGENLATRMMREITTARASHNQWKLDVLHSNPAARNLYASLGFVTERTVAWIGKHLLHSCPQSSEPRSALDTDSTFDCYGFTRASVAGQAVSIVGTSVRCNTVQQFLDDTFLSEVQRIYPPVAEAFVVVPVSDLNSFQEDRFFEIARSDRMFGTF